MHSHTDDASSARAVHKPEPAGSGAPGTKAREADLWAETPLRYAAACGLIHLVSCLARMRVERLARPPATAALPLVSRPRTRIICSKGAGDKVQRVGHVFVCVGAQAGRILVHVWPCGWCGGIPNPCSLAPPPATAPATAPACTGTKARADGDVVLGRPSSTRKDPSTSIGPPLPPHAPSPPCRQHGPGFTGPGNPRQPSAAGYGPP
jgi:hypothetical protein